MGNKVMAPGGQQQSLKGVVLLDVAYVLNRSPKKMQFL